MRVYKWYKILKSSENERNSMKCLIVGRIISPTSKHAFLKPYDVPDLIIITFAFSSAVLRYEGIFIRYPSDSNFFSDQWLYAILATFLSNSSIICRHINQSVKSSGTRLPNQFQTSWFSRELTWACKPIRHVDEYF